MSEPFNILLVDDRPENLAILESILKGEGHRVRATLSGELALNAVSIDPPDVILLDVMMPGMDGYAVCERLKTAAQTAPIPVLFISALNEPNDKVRGFAAGAVDFISKPFDNAEVLARVSAHAELYRARRQLSGQNAALQKALDDLRWAQSRLVSSAKMASLGVLTAGIAHELNNPINFVFANAQSCLKLLPQLEAIYDRYDAMTTDNAAEAMQAITVLKQAIGYEECRVGLRQLLEGIRVGSERSANIIRSLRLFSREGVSQPTAFDLHENIDTALLMLGRKIGRDIRLEKDFQAMATVIGQPGPLNQVIVNLVSNAVDAIRAKPETTGAEKIVIRTYDDKVNGHSAVVVEVEDTGSGLSPGAEAHLFEPFYTTKPVGTGIGLGLSIAHSIVEEHGGSLEAMNVAGGACFRLVLPR